MVVKLINPRNTSQKSGSFGAKVEKSLATSIHNCHHCGLILDRDHNAIIIILDFAILATVNVCGVEPLDLAMKQETTCFNGWYFTVG